MTGSNGFSARPSALENARLLIIESDLHRTVSMAEVLEQSGGRIVGVASDRESALAIAEGENADFTAVDAAAPLGDARRKTATTVCHLLGTPTLAISLSHDIHRLRNGFQTRTSFPRTQRDWR